VYRLPDSLRSEFQNPMGPVLSTEQLLRELRPKDRVVAVGDIVAKTLIEAKRDPWIIVVDFKTQRGADDPELKTVLGSWGQKVMRVANPPATVSDELFHAVQQSLKSKLTVRIEVTGEEDLAGLPYLALAKDGVVMVYGVPNKGVAMVRVDKGVRVRALELLALMEVRTEPRRLKT
jgi:GTP-dependent dephospho-CoA kinase